VPFERRGVCNAICHNTLRYNTKASSTGGPRRKLTQQACAPAAKAAAVGPMAIGGRKEPGQRRVRLSRRLRQPGRCGADVAVCGSAAEAPAVRARRVCKTRAVWPTTRDADNQNPCAEGYATLRPQAAPPTPVSRVPEAAASAAAAASATATATASARSRDCWRLSRSALRDPEPPAAPSQPSASAGGAARGFRKPCGRSSRQTLFEHLLFTTRATGFHGLCVG
jgi:hypothetical protein